MKQTHREALIEMLVHAEFDFWEESPNSATFGKNGSTIVLPSGTVFLFDDEGQLRTIRPIKEMMK
jgi:hypothetical protein